MKARTGFSWNRRRSRAAIPAQRPSIVAESSPPEPSVGLDDLLVDQLRDLLHAEKQLTKALASRWSRPPATTSSRAVRQSIWPKPKRRSNVWTSASSFLARQPRAKACKGMQGLVEEGDEVIKEGKRRTMPLRISR